MTAGWRMTRAPGGRRVAMRWIRDNNSERKDSEHGKGIRNQDGAPGASRIEGGTAGGRGGMGAKRAAADALGAVHLRAATGTPARRLTLAPLQPAAPQMNLSAAVAACVASSYGAVPVREMDDETTQVTVVARTGGAR